MRVHELAKELRLDNKEFMLKLKDMGIEAKNHMCALNDDQVEKIKERLVKIIKESIVEQRVMPTVIRRRKKVEVIEPSPQEQLPAPPVKQKPVAGPEMPEDGQGVEAAPVATGEQTAPAPPLEEAQQDQVTPVKKISAEQKSTPSAPAVKKSKKLKKEVPARIVQRVEPRPAVVVEEKKQAPPPLTVEVKPKDKQLIKPLPAAEETEGGASAGKPKKWKTRRSKETLYDDTELEGLPGADHLPRKVREVIGVKRKKLQVVPASSFQKKRLAVVEARKPEITVPRQSREKYGYRKASASENLPGEWA